MQWVMYGIVLVYGMIFGSFYNVVGIRLPKGYLFSSKRSACPNCQRTLSWYELFPVFSFLIQKGKCRSCEQKISVVYPIFELLTGGLFLLSYISFGFTADFYFSLTLISFLVILTISDLYYFIIPNRLYLIFSPLLVPLSHLTSGLSLKDRLLSAGVIALVFIGILLVFKEGLGMGDVKLFLFLAYLFGLEMVLYCIMLSSFLGILYFYIFNRKDLTARLPFGPFIAASTLVLFFLSQLR